jgi:hypothetical protein
MPLFYPYVMGLETDEFFKFVDLARQFRTRSEIELLEVPAPQRLAPHALALSADVAEIGSDEDIATGRFVLLHDPAGQESWDGNFRAVTFIRSSLEADMQSDPVLADVAWSWVAEALERAGAEYFASGGTVTRAASKSFGGLKGSDDSSEIEIRASWTPRDSSALSAHLQGWLYLIELAAGLTPLEEGVSALKKRR